MAQRPPASFQSCLKREGFIQARAFIENRGEFILNLTHLGPGRWGMIIPRTKPNKMSQKINNKISTLRSYNEKLLDVGMNMLKAHGGKMYPIKGSNLLLTHLWRTPRIGSTLRDLSFLDHLGLSPSDHAANRRISAHPEHPCHCFIFRPGQPSNDWGRVLNLECPSIKNRGGFIFETPAAVA